MPISGGPEYAAQLHRCAIAGFEPTASLNASCAIAQPLVQSIHERPTKTEILALLVEHQQALARLGVQRLGLFGSFVREQQDAASDVDVLVEFAPGRKSFDSFMHVAFYLEDLFGRPVDLLTPESLSPHLGPRILPEIEYVALDR